MKKKLSLLFALLLVAAIALTACTKDDSTPDRAGEGHGEPVAPVTVKVGASITPHAEILEAARADFEAKGYTLDIIEFTDYVKAYLALDGGDLVAF